MAIVLDGKTRSSEWCLEEILSLRAKVTSLEIELKQERCTYSHELACWCECGWKRDNDHEHEHGHE